MGSSGSTSGQGGAVDYPAYMKNWHQIMLTDTYTIVTGNLDAPTTFMYDPKVWFGIPGSGVSAYAVLSKFSALDTEGLFKTLLSDDPSIGYVLGEAAVIAIKSKAEELRALVVDPAGASTECENMIDAHSTKLLQKINTDVMPRVEVGMRDVNAVIGTSFVIARELVMEDYMHEVADFSAKSRMHLWELRHELYKFIENAWIQGAVHAAEAGLRRVATELDKLKLEASLTSEVANLATLAQSKYGVVQTEKETRSKTWKVDMYNHMNASLAAISGAHTVTTGHSQGSSVLSGVIGGGASGASAGAAFGPWGAVIGGVGGALLGALGSRR